MEISRISSTEELERVTEALSELEQNVACANVFYENWMLLPAFKFLRKNGEFIVLIWSKGKGSLLGAFPLQLKSSYHRLPLRYYSLWKHLHCFLSNPLIRAGYELECLSTLFLWLRNQPYGRTIFEFEQIVSQGSFFEELKSFAQSKGLKFDVRESYDRPLLQRVLNAENYLRSAISGKHFRKLQKKHMRLSQLGELEYHMLSDNDPTQQWVDNFLKLEQSGWKGRKGSAMLQHADQALFFQSVIENAQANGKLKFSMLSLNKKPIAMRCNFISLKNLFSFKIAFDEDYAEYSPGVLLELEHMRYLQTKPEIKWDDSCAMPGQITLERLWKERRPISSIVVSNNTLLGRCLVSSVIQLKKWRRLFSPASASGSSLITASARSSAQT